jgi:two-component system, NtrC family, sensor kinase
MAQGPKPAKGKAKPAVVRKSPKNDAARVHDLEKRLAEALQREALALEQLQRRDRELTEALEQQTATNEILRVISRSPDVQAVFDVIVRSAVELTSAEFGGLLRTDGREITMAASHGVLSGSLETAESLYPMPLDKESLSGRAILSRAIQHAPDIEALPSPPRRSLEVTRAAGFRSQLTVPLLRGEEAIGSITVSRREARPFSETQIKLLQTFADQAVIAIENVRLFNETKEALERQTATSEILRVISQSPTDIRPVLETIVEHAGRVCGAFDAIVFLVEGDQLVRTAHRGPVPITEGRLSLPIARDSASGVAVLDCRTVHMEDILASHEFPRTRAIAQRSEFRTAVSVPLVKEGAAIGTLVVRRTEVQAFTAEQIALLETFADQAVIAIENVRLFTELQASNRELTTALDTQTATSDILRVISRSRTDVQPVFDAIVQSAVRLLRAHSGMLTRVAGDWLELAAFTSIDRAYDDAIRAYWPRPLHSKGGHTQAIRERAPINIADAGVDPRVPEAGRAVARLSGIRSVASVPLLRNDEAIGTVVVNRQEPGGFTNDEITLLQTFADQAVIAIENVRLFKELEASNRELTTALDKQTATSEILRAITHAPTDTQPVFDTIVRSAAALCGAAVAGLFLTDGRTVSLPANYGSSPEGLRAVRTLFPRPLDMESTGGRAILMLGRPRTRQRRAHGGRAGAADRTAGRLPEPGHGADVAPGRSRGRYRRVPSGARPVLRRGGGAPQNLRRPSRHRD